MSTDARTIRADRFAEIGMIIQRDVTIIVDRWAERARQDQPQAQRVHLAVLLDDMPRFLAGLGRSLESSGNAYHSPHSQSASEHGEQRWQTGWSLQELIRDYQILRIVILDYLDETLDRSLRLREILAVGLALDEAIAASVSRFVQFCDQRTTLQNEALQQADRRKNEFLATLAHELRNPLAPLRNALDVIRLNSGAHPTIDPFREIMERQVQQITRLVDDLLDMSRFELGKLTLRKECLDLRAVLTDAVQSVAPLAQARQQTVAWDAPPEPLWVEGDEARLEQVFVNLLQNAIKFTPIEGKIQVRAESEAAVVTVHVTDTGAGIPAEMLARVFDLFAQVEGPREHEMGGLGIGLALVRRLVERHGGHVAVTSEGLGRGSDFTVSLPLLPAGAVAVPEAIPVASVASKQRILLIEDHADGRDSLALLLRLCGHEVLVAEDGTRGLELARSESPDVALVDIGLPDIDGYEVARRLRQSKGTNLYLIALTGFSQPEDRRRTAEAGFNSHLTKPVDIQTLQTLLASRPERTA